MTVNKYTKHFKARPGFIFILIIAASYLLGVLTYSQISPLLASLNTPKIGNQIIELKLSPSPIQMPTPSPVAEIKQAPKPQQPSERALKVAGTTYALYPDEAKREKIRAMANIPKSNENTEIIQYALWFDKNPGYLAKIEAAIDEYKLQQSKAQINVPPPLPAQNNLTPLRCTSNTIGDYTYTNCY